MDTLYVSFDTLKNTIGSYQMYYVEDDTHYYIVVVKPDFVHICQLSKSIDTADVSDFEANYKSNAIQTNSIDDAIAQGYANL